MRAASFSLLFGLSLFGGVVAAPLEARKTQAKATVREVHVVTSGAFTAAFKALAKKYQRETGVRVVTEHGPSMGDTPQAIPNRLARHEEADVVILARGGLDKLVEQGRVACGSAVDLGLSKIAVAVRAGAPVPDISTTDAVRATLLHAKSVAWSDSASGVYIQSTMLDRLGIADEVRPKGRMIPATPVGTIVARGEAELGFQQLSELKPVKGIRIVGLLPDALQKVTPFSAGMVSYSTHPGEARALIAYLSSPRAFPIIRDSGLEPAAQKAKP
ncbi:substrate-binding domain-containing protein [Sphingomonas sp. Mn802worker]|uniref:substrate-binding domain-containing protein n=1 Tax=Sphingomonas sp. Mn802worker TaxID=629773 RepID=UPI0003AB2EEA|nr:substrate-binding domain-containing protein [Sphingomonas sp. Mn802worker]